MQTGDWGNVLIRHVREWKHRKHSPWACLFSGVEFRGDFYFQKIIFLQLLHIWSSYCFHCDTDQLWTHTQSNNKTKCLKQILLTVKNQTPHLHWVKWNWKAADIWTHYNYKCKPFEDMTTPEHGDINNLDEVMDLAAQSWVIWLCCWRCPSNRNWSHQGPQNDCERQNTLTEGLGTHQKTYL